MKSNQKDLAIHLFLDLFSSIIVFLYARVSARLFFIHVPIHHPFVFGSISTLLFSTSAYESLEAWT